MKKMIPFTSARWAPGGHLQTIIAYLLPAPKGLPGTRLHRIPISHGDVLVMCENRPVTPKTCGLVLLLHGLGGYADSPYMLRTAARFLQRGWTTFRLNHRGAGQGRGLARQTYHAGRSKDLEPVLQAIARANPALPLVAVGFSLSGNMLLKYLGEGNSVIAANLCGALAVSPPLKLALAAAAISKAGNRLYDLRFVRLLRQSLRERRENFPGFTCVDLPWHASVYRFDQLVTAPLNGFSSAEEYYEQCSAHQFLGDIALPTVIIAGDDDPFIPEALFADLPHNNSVHVHLTRSGGHLGFISSGKTAFGDHHWLDEALVRYAEGFYAKALSSVTTKQADDDEV